MDKLPKGWKHCVLLDCIDLINGRAYKQEELLDKGVPVLRIQNLNGGSNWYYSNLKLPEKNYCKNGDLLFAWSASFGPYIYEGDKAIYHYHIWKIDVKPNIIKRYAFYFLEHFTKEVRNHTVGVAMFHITKSKMEQIAISLPPLPEQTRIVNKLDSLFERIDKGIVLLEENIKHTEALMASVLDGVFVQAENNKHFEIRLLKDVVHVINGRAYKQEELLDNGKYPVIRVGNFFSNRSWYYSDLELDKDKYCDKGDLLYAWSASFGPKIWDGDKSIYHYHIWKMEIISSNLLKDYLYYMLLRDTEKIKSEGGRGVGMIHITKGDIEVRKITLPPINIQNQIVEKIKVLNQNLEKLLKEQKSKLSYLKALKASLLDKAFKGEL